MVDKYCLYSVAAEIKCKERRNIRPYVAVVSGNELVFKKGFQSLDEAIEELGNYQSHITQLSGANGIYFLVEEYVIIDNQPENTCACGETCAISHFEIDVIEKPGYETIATFDNYAEAEDALAEIDDGFIGLN